MRDIQLVLDRWGAWIGCGTDNVGYTPIAAGFKGLLPASRRSRASCCDSDGLIVDSAVNHLKKKDAYLYKLLEFYYVKNMSLRAIASTVGISLNQVVIRLQTAEGFVDGCLAAIGLPLEMDRYCEKENIYPPAQKKVVL